jgi:plasmid stabilization system protein ParE
LAHLHSLRASLRKARDALMHFQGDRVDRDKLEPAARRVDELMNLFANGSRNPEQGFRFVTEIQSGVEQLTNSKSADALRDAQVDIVALLDAMRGEGSGSRPASQSVV